MKTICRGEEKKKKKNKKQWGKQSSTQPLCRTLLIAQCHLMVQTHISAPTLASPGERYLVITTKHKMTSKV